LNQNLSEDIYSGSITDSIKHFTELYNQQDYLILIQLIEMITAVE